MFLRGLWDVSLNGDLFETSQGHLMPAGISPKQTMKFLRIFIDYDQEDLAKQFLKRRSAKTNPWEQSFKLIHTLSNSVISVIFSLEMVFKFKACFILSVKKLICAHWSNKHFTLTCFLFSGFSITKFAVCKRTDEMFEA